MSGHVESADVDIPPRPDGCVRIATWNCGGGLRRELACLEEIDADVIVVQEADNLERLAWTRPGVWTGDLHYKGLAVLGRDGVELAVDPSYDDRIEYVLPVRVRADGLDFSVLAVWASNHRAKRFHPLEPTTSQTLQLASLYGHLFDEGPCIVLGDFNNHTLWDKPGKAVNFANVVTRYRELGLVSASHAHGGTEIGDGADPHTIHWRYSAIDGAGYHIDYVFLPEQWVPAIRSVSLGTHTSWVASRRSDHLPIVVDLDLSTLRSKAGT